jgi:hypothetical protein
MAILKKFCKNYTDFLVNKVRSRSESGSSTIISDPDLVETWPQIRTHNNVYTVCTVY